jgi:hypothetical protein
MSLFVFLFLGKCARFKILLIKLQFEESSLFTIDIFVEHLANLYIIYSLDETYVVNKSYEAKSRDEISIDQGSFITVLEKSFTGWWIVR